ncbi:PREDICTED: uncharacterized protein LOC108362404 [Rhagoletis zephyria]|uniref:uncharacterized protein LOC108362404 n=1 Tax=Rhagoletis zephyria TaxID=28612 RepID=UPI00081158CD|nr:PREDICTED: uncharacterized protein LOC108362404 [Rhagoletis zephyria]
MATGTCKVAKRLLTCFCGCSEMSEEEVRRIYRLNAQDTLNDSRAAQIFRRFLEQERCGDKSEVENFLDIYEICGEFLREDSLTFEQLNTLIEMELKYYLEKKLNLYIMMIEEKQRQDIHIHEIERDLKRIQADYRSEIEASEEYRNYKHAILNKLKQVP